MTMMGALRLGDDVNVLVVVDAKTRDYCVARKAVLRRPRWACAGVDLATLAVSGAGDVDFPEAAVERWRALRGDAGFRGLDARVSRGVDGRVLGGVHETPRNVRGFPTLEASLSVGFQA